MPQIHFVKDTFSFGEIKKGDSVKAMFSFTNTGKAELRIKKTGVSCGCTGAFSADTLLLPGEGSAIHATYHSGKDSGKVLKTIIVESNADPVLHILYITGYVKALSQDQTRPGF